LLYPLQSGALEGLTPNSLIQQAEVAGESLGKTHWGLSLRDFFKSTDEYSQLDHKLNQYVSLHSDLEAISDSLADHQDHIETVSWRSSFDDAFDTDVNELHQTLEECQQAIRFAAKYESIKDTLDTDEFDLTATKELLAAIKSPQSQPNPVAIKYCDVIFDTVKKYTSAKNTLSVYDLSNIHNTLQNALQANAGSRQSVANSLENVQSLLDAAVETETARQTLDLSHSGITHNEISHWIQAALAEVSVENIRKAKSAVSNLKEGVWKPEYLQKYTPAEFEHLVADLFADYGYRTTVTKQSNDGGIDVMAYSGSETIAIQVKQYSPGNRVGRPTVQQIAGVQVQIDATKAIVVTSSDFTQTAKEASQQYGDTMELINGTKLIQRLSRSGLTPPTGSSRENQQRHRRTQQSTSNSQRNTRSSYSENRNDGRFCMVCGERFQANLEQVKTPAGETIRCCPRCKQLLEQRNDMQDHSRSDAFQALGLSTGASQAEIKQAYRERVHKVHPDQGGSNEEFQQVQQAYETLLN
jgi:HJR/Mrr/RecB family endonuclease